MPYLERELIGVVGHPTHGKSTALRVIQKMTGAVIFDTGEPLRRACMELYGLSWEDVSTQAGKAKMVRRPELGDTVSVRQALGDYGKLLEAKSSDKNIWTSISVAGALDTLFPVLAFDSVRMGQGEVIQKQGGVVIAVHDPRKPKSSFDFDQYDPRFVDFVIENASSLERFERSVSMAVEYLLPHRFTRLAA